MASPDKEMVKYEIRRQQLKRRRRMVATFAGVVVLVAAIALMVPALSITSDRATNEAGFFPQSGNQQSQQGQLLAGGIDSTSTSALSAEADPPQSVAGKMYQFNLPKDGFMTLTGLVDSLGLVDGTDFASASELVASAQNVTFSDPSLMSVHKADQDTTVGKIKDDLSLRCEYSAELTSEEIQNADATQVASGDWALIALKPFSTTEALTVSMEDGTSFTVRITDRQAGANVLVFDGKTYTVTVSYDDAAGIPDGTELAVREIEPGSDEYLQYLGKTWSEVNKEYLEAQDTDANGKKVDDASDVDAHLTNLDVARFFDITLLHEGKEIEPKTPVKVEINYTNGLEATGATEPGVVHFKADEVELIDGVQADVENDAAFGFSYEQDSFSVVGTYISRETRDPETPPLGAQSASPTAASTSGDAGMDGQANDVRVFDVAPVALRGTATGEKSSSADDSQLEKPTGNKTLKPNDDGTYTLTLSVRGSSITEIQEATQKSNVLFVMDRSSSMITNTVSDDEDYWYYGTRNTAVFRGDITPSQGYQFYGEINDQMVPLNASVNWGSASFTYQSGNSWAAYPDDAPLYVKSKTTRLYAEQKALDDVIGRLLAYNGKENDTIEVALISFGDHRFDTKNDWKNETEHSEWVQGTDKSDLMRVVNSNRFTSGTNWEEALQYALEVISSKKAQDGNDENYYVVFLTDGEPTNMVGDTSAAAHTGDSGNKLAYDAAKDEALKLVRNEVKFYNIFTYRKNESEKYSKYLTNYAYSNGQSDYDETDTQAVQTYFSDAQTVDALNDAFNNIFLTIADVTGHANVSITDTLTTDAMTTTVVRGKTNGYVYTVKDQDDNVLYTVTSTGDLDNPTVTFNVPSSRTKTYTATSSVVDGKKVYSVATAEGVTYRMALADVDNETGELEWDLSPVGVLMNGCEYSVSFVVWPDQGAYDYVAALNNGLEGYTWSTSTATYEDLRDTKGYEKGGVEQYPSIVKRSDGTFAVLTNEDQKIHYSVVEMQTINGEPNGEPTVHGPYYSDLQTPDPMPLTASESKIQKVWNVERDPGILARYLYEADGSSKEFSIDYDIMRGTEAKPYTSVHLGWDSASGQYVWEPSSVRTVTYNGHEVEVGTRWSDSFAIATGLMLSEERMDALGLDKKAYPSGTYPEGTGTKYYILETGHDYTIKEDSSSLGYEFDFVSPVYHPMLVNGVLQSVNFTGYTEGMPIVEPGDDVTITSMTSSTVGLDSLKVENTLRGYINLEKDIVDKDGRTPLPADETKFAYTVVLENDTQPGPFVTDGSHVPWYGISGLFYHSIDEDGIYHYYQAEPNGEGHVNLTDESGNVFDATCEGVFAEDVGPVPITYTEGGVTKTIQLYGNQMDRRDDNYVSAELMINQDQVLDIANVPAGTTYTITETPTEGYDLVDIHSEVRNGSIVESGTTIDDGRTAVTGEIVADRDNHVTFTNKVHSVDVTVKKLDENGKPMTGAVFTLTKAKADGEANDTVLTKPGDGEADSGEYEFVDLADGSYTLHETPPEGYAAMGDVAFAVAGGQISNMGKLPKGVTWDADTLTFTVVNEPAENSGKITVRKQWLDFFGNATSHDGEIGLTLLQWAKNVESQHTVTVKFRFDKNGSWQDAITMTGTGYGNATIEWSWNSYTHTSNIQSISVSGGGATYDSLGDERFRLTVPNSNADVEVVVDVRNNNYDPWTSYGNNPYSSSIRAVQMGTSPAVQEGMALTGGQKAITLGADGVWSQRFTVSGDGLLSDASATLPATYNGKPCYYSIAEDPSLEGYDVSYSVNNEDGIQSGVLTAYNRSTSVDVTVKKVDKNNSSVLLGGATFRLRQIDPTKTGSMDARALDGGVTGEQTTSSDDGDKGTLTFASLGQGYYEIKETSAPDGYTLNNQADFFVLVEADAAHLLKKDESKPASEWAKIQGDATMLIENATVTVKNESGEALPTTGGIGTTVFTVVGVALVAVAVVLLLRRRRK